MARLRSTLVPVKSQHLPLLCWSLMPVFFTSVLKCVSLVWRLSWLSVSFCMLVPPMAFLNAFSVGEVL